MLQIFGSQFDGFDVFQWALMTKVTSFASSESFKTQFGISSGPGEVRVWDVDRALRTSKTVNEVAISG